MSFVISRREALAGIGATLALAGASPAHAADLPLVRVSIVPIFAVAPHFAAVQEGYFTQEGIAVSTQPVQGGAVGIPGLVSGSFDVLYGNSISTLTAWSRGIDLRIIAEGTPITPDPPDPGALIIRRGENLRSGKDFEGKILGVNAKYDIQWLVMQTWAKKTGADLDKITYREVPLPSMLDALKNHQVDGALVLDPFMTVGLADPAFERTAWPLSTAMPGLPTSFWLITADAATNKTALIRSYQKAFLKGGKWINDHAGDDAYCQLIAGYTHTDPKLVAKMVVGKQPMSVDVPSIGRLADLMKDNGLLKNDVDYKDKVFT